ncbi:MAG: NADH-quinone oxidoreductase subunit L, partial [Armatimonadota bacterium]|nr:NADH-quinone oxidoreductase subunit L [Armatimonadota bacterium]
MPLALIVLFPLIGFIINGFIGRKMPKPVPGVIACVAVLASFIVAVVRFMEVVGQADHSITEHVYTWMSVGDLTIDVSFLLDQLSGVMILIVTGVGFLIHVYSAGYMEHDHNDPQGTLYARYFTFLNLFIAFMSILVLADNYLLMFVGWEGVGLCSYFLIGFWFNQTEPAEASKKAFVVNRIGDFGFLLGMLLIFLTVGSLDYTDVFQRVRDFDVDFIPGVTLVTAITLLLFVGATGKSAQIPLFVWLPDAMAGPTPVSALIHAATMVTAGVYMVARSSALFEAAPATKLIVCTIGALTALFAGLTALAHTDIKKVLAYSTVSQLGFMFMGAGAGAYTAAIFHVFTHAFFKACLFLGSGSVIHALHGEQDMRKMGGLADKMKITNITFMLSGLALAGAAPFSGFFSKDEIIATVFAAGEDEKVYLFLGAVGLVTAFVTALYTGRQYAQVFLGTPRFEHSAAAHGEHHGHDAHETAEEHAAHDAHDPGVHESPPTMTIPLIILAVGAVLAGFLGVPHIPGAPEQLHAFANWLNPLFEGSTAAHGAGHGAAAHPEHPVNWLLLGLGAAIGWAGWVFGRSLGINASRALLTEPYNRLSLDQIYNATVV